MKKKTPEEWFLKLEFKLPDDTEWLRDRRVWSEHVSCSVLTQAVRERADRSVWLYGNSLVILYQKGRFMAFHVGALQMLSESEDGCRLTQDSETQLMKDSIFRFYYSTFQCSF